MIIWLCVLTVHKQRHDSIWKLGNQRLKIGFDGGRILMAIDCTLMIVQMGIPTGACVVCSQMAVRDKAEY